MTKKLNTHEAAAFLNLSAGTLEVWRCTGRGPKYAKLGRSGILRLRQKGDHHRHHARTAMKTNAYP